MCRPVKSSIWRRCRRRSGNWASGNKQRLRCEIFLAWHLCEMTERKMSEAELLRVLDQRLRGLSVEGLWSPASDADMATYNRDPHTTVLAHVWKWPELYAALQTVANMHGLDGKAERRVLR